MSELELQNKNNEVEESNIPIPESVAIITEDKSLGWSKTTSSNSSNWRRTKDNKRDRKYQSRKDKIKEKKSVSPVRNTEDGSDSDEEDDDAIPVILNQVPIQCPIGKCKEMDILHTDPIQVKHHLKKDHSLVIKNIYHTVTYLQTYLEYWSTKLNSSDDWSELLIKGVDNDNNLIYIIQPDKIELDKNIRLKLQQQKLIEVLDIQSNERKTIAQLPRKCLFCQHVMKNRIELFQHMYSEHGFNIGLPDNLVNVESFLNLLEDRLVEDICIYCKKKFTDSIVLRKHMRKKKHFKIHSKDHLFDLFYMINYAEPDKFWEQLELEQDENLVKSSNKNHSNKKLDLNEELELNDINEDGEWMDWVETEVEITNSLFNNLKFNSPEDCLDYTKNQFNFDLIGLCHKLDLNFYQRITLINYLRHCYQQHQCITCSTQYSDNDQLLSHYSNEDCLRIIPDLSEPYWKDVNYLIPIIEEDPLLMFFDDDGDGDGDDGVTEPTKSEDSPKHQVIKVQDSLTDLKNEPQLDPSQQAIYDKLSNLNI